MAGKLCHHLFPYFLSGNDKQPSTLQCFLVKWKKNYNSVAFIVKKWIVNLWQSIAFPLQKFDASVNFETFSGFLFLPAKHNISSYSIGSATKTSSMKKTWCIELANTDIGSSCNRISFLGSKQSSVWLHCLHLPKTCSCQKIFLAPEQKAVF